MGHENGKLDLFRNSVTLYTCELGESSKAMELILIKSPPII